MDARSTLLDAALALFAHRGYDAVGVQEIVEAAGVTKPTLYHHFGNKQGLLESLIRERLAPLDRAIEEACRYRGDLPRTLEELVTAHLGFAERQPMLHLLWLSMQLSPPGSVSRQVAEGPRLVHRSHLEAMFVAASEQHGNLRGRQRRLAVSLLGLVDAHVPLVIAQIPSNVQAPAFPQAPAVAHASSFPQAPLLAQAPASSPAELPPTPQLVHELVKQFSYGMYA